MRRKNAKIAHVQKNITDQKIKAKKYTLPGSSDSLPYLSYRLPPADALFNLS